MRVRRSHPHPDSDLAEHAKAVARFTNDILQTSLCESLRAWGELFSCVAGHCHDLLKDTEAFERHLNGAGKSEQSRHSGGGAFIAWIVCGRIMEASPSLLTDSPLRQTTPHIVFSVLAAHHSGLRRVDLYGQHEKAVRHWQETRSSTSTKMLSEIQARFDGVPDTQDLDTELAEARKHHFLLKKGFDNIQADDFFSSFFLARLCLGALSRADIFSAQNQEAGSPEPEHFPSSQAKVSFHVDTARFADSSGLNGLRCRFQNWAAENWNEYDRIFQLKAPTGLGKTVAVTRIAEKALAQNPNARIFYLAPTVAILNQVYGQLRQFKTEGDAVLLHYLARDYDSDEEPDYQPGNYTEKQQARDAKINDLDAGLIVTTYHRLLRLLGGLSKTTCLNLAGLRNAIWILDECQSLTHYQTTTVTSLFAAVAKATDSRFILMSATPPETEYINNSFLKLKWQKPPTVHPLLTAAQLAEITNDPHVNGRRVVQPLPSISQLEELAAKVCEYRRKHPDDSLLVLLNLAGDVRKLHPLLEGKADFMITTYLRPVDVGSKLREAEEYLAQEKPILMIATSIVQAGVDLDFDAGFVELNDLRDFRQGCGRVGRNFMPERSRCQVFAFELKDSRETSSWYRQRFARKIKETEDHIIRDALNTNCDIIQGSVARILAAKNPLTDIDIERIEHEASQEALRLSKNVFERLAFGFPRSYDNSLHTEDRYQGFSFIQLKEFIMQDSEEDADCSALAIFMQEDEAELSALQDKMDTYREQSREMYSADPRSRFKIQKKLRKLKQEILTDASPFLVRRFDVVREFERSHPKASYYDEFDFWIVINPTAYSRQTGWRPESSDTGKQDDSAGIAL